jgi:hypothetical protein
MVAARNPNVKKAVVTLQRLSADEQTRDMYERREKAIRDIDSRERWAETRGIKIGETRGKKQGEKNIIDLLKSGKSSEEIIRDYGN